MLNKISILLGGLTQRYLKPYLLGTLWLQGGIKVKLRFPKNGLRAREVNQYQKLYFTASTCKILPVSGVTELGFESINQIQG